MIIRTMYKVKEIFKSIQGEGFHSGKNAVFIRFSGCNLWNGIEKFRKKQFVTFVILILLEWMVKMVVSIN